MRPISIALNFMRSATHGTLIAVIFFISPVLASDDPSACPPQSASLGKVKAAETPKKIPPITLIDDTGRKISLPGDGNRGTVLNFWATWCAPCVREMPELDALHDTLRGEGIDVLAASVDRGGHSAIKGFYAQTGIKHLAALHDPKSAASRALGVRGLPTTVIISADGYEIARIEGIHHYDTPEMAAYLKRCIAPK